MPTSGRPRELWFTGPRCVEVRPGEVPALGPGQVLARALASGISQGTELLLYAGEGPTPFDPSLDPPGAATYPRRYGYAWVGEVVGGPPAHLGHRIFALAPHGDARAIDADRLRVLPPSVPATRAVLAANLETAVTCVWDAPLALGDRVVVLGGGVVGLLSGYLAARSGCEVTVVEPSERRRTVARELGLRSLSPEEDRPAAEADVVIEATGQPSALDRAIAHAATEGTIVVASFYGARTAPLALGDAFHRRRLVLRASQVSRLPPERTPRWTFDRRFELVRRLLGEPALDRLLDPPADFDHAPAVYARLARAPGDAMQTVFVYA